MHPVSQATIRNCILSRLPARDFELLRPKLSPISLAVRQRLELPNRPIENIVFIEHGIVSVVARGLGDDTIEIGVIGREGMTGLPVVMGTDRSPHETYVQAAGGGWSITADDLRGEMQKSRPLAELCRFSTQAFFVQTACTALANGRATIDTRLARWLLMAQDRMDSAELVLTHDFLAIMLGVRRSGVTSALGLLVKQNLIVQIRGKIVIRDREGLIKKANGFFGAPEREHLRLFGNGNALLRRTA